MRTRHSFQASKDGQCQQVTGNGLQGQTIVEKSAQPRLADQPQCQKAEPGCHVREPVNTSADGKGKTAWGY